MPTYEYQCDTCGSVFDVFQSIKAKPLRKAACASCGKVSPVKRLIGTGGAVLFKGSGFYQTDYRSKGYTEAAKAESGTKSDPAADSSKKDGAVKPAATAEKSIAPKEPPTSKTTQSGKSKKTE